MALATLSIDIEAKLANLEQGMDKASRLVEKNTRQIEGSFSGLKNAGAVLGGVLTGAFAALGTAGLANLFVNVNAGVNALKDLKEASGASIENISALEDVAARTGTNFETVGGSLLKFNKALEDAGKTPEIAAVFKGLNLDIETLKALDPAEALRQTAVALAGFADDGNKARAAQELFGRSLKDVAPFLANLAEQGRLVATVTTEQALAAEKFNNQLEALKKTALDASRSLAGPVVASLNAVSDRFTQARREGQTLLETLAGFTSVGSLFGIGRTKIEELADYNNKIEKITKTLDKANLPVSYRIEQERKLIELRTKAAALAEELGIKEAGAGRGLVVPELVRPSLDVPGATGSTKASKAKADRESEFDRYIKRLSEAQIATLDLSAEEQARIDIVSGKLGKLTEVQEVQLLSLARGLDALKAPPVIFGPDIDAGLLEQRTQAQRDLQRLLDESQVGKIGALVEVERSLNEAFREGSVDADQYASALAALDKRFADISPAVKETAEKIDEFTKQASRNIQDALGDSTLKVLRGDFESIGQLWKDLIQKMLAQAVAAKLGSFLLGDFSTSGNIGGVVGQVIGLFGTGGGAGTAAPNVIDAGGGRAGALSAGAGRTGSSNAGITLTQTVNVGQGVSRGEVAVAVNEGNRALMAQLQAAGRI